MYNLSINNKIDILFTFKNKENNYKQIRIITTKQINVNQNPIFIF